MAGVRGRALRPVPGADRDRFDGARGDAGTAIDAFVGVNIQHFRRLKLGFILPRMDAVHGAHIDARGVLRAYTWFADDIRHANTSPVTAMSLAVLPDRV